MWLRSQDKTELINTKRIQVEATKIYAFVDIEDGYIKIGEYANSVRAVEVLDQIQQKLMEGHGADVIIGGTRVYREYVFDMPEQ